MKQYILSIFILLLSVSSLLSQPAGYCGWDDLYQQNLERIPGLDLKTAEMEELTRQLIRERASQTQPRNGEIITIPVVVHLVFKDESHDISDLQVQSQIEVLNEDFRLLNDAVQSIPAEFQPFAADTEIEFCLASLNPDGLPATGITRTQTDIDCIGDIFTVKVNEKPRLFYSNLGGASAWDTEHYLNIWVANSCNTFLGVASSLAFSVLVPEEDGVVIDHQYFGNNCESCPSAPYHLGRTATHEIGHYLNLYHLWSNGNCDDPNGDYVDDTPTQEDPYYGCPSYPQKSCGSNDMYMNFMNYADDRCMSMFTQGQKMRMLATLDSLRKGLKSSAGCAWLPPKLPFDDSAIEIYPNPAADCIRIDFNATISGDVVVELRNVQGQLLFRDVESARSFRSIDAASLPNGIYFISFDAGKRRITKKVLVAK